jgi:hypothetical protein
MIIKRNAQRSYRMQKNLLNNMKDFNLASSVRLDSDVEKKKRVYNKLEYEVSAIKNETVEQSKKLEQYNKEIIETDLLIQEQNRRNEKSYNENKSLTKDYLGSKIKLLQIYKRLKVKNLESIIETFKDERIQYQGYYSQVILKKLSFIIVYKS